MNWVTIHILYAVTPNVEDYKFKGIINTMIVLDNRAITRIQQLLELDIKKLKHEIGTFDNTAVERANDFLSSGKYDLTPATKEDAQKQLQSSEDTLKQISDEVNKATFVFGLSSRNTEPAKEEIKGLQIK